MKIIVAFLLILCVSCGTAAAQSSPAPTPSPAPTATPAPDYRPCISALAFALVHHQHQVYEWTSAGHEGLWTATGVVPAPPAFTMNPDDKELSTLLAQFCVGAIDEEILSQLAEITGN